MQRADYIHSSAAIRVKEKGLLNQSYFLRLTDLESAGDVSKALSDSIYAERVLAMESISKYWDVFSPELVNVYNFVREQKGGEAVYSFVALKYDMHNIKVLLKSMILDEDLSELYSSIGRISVPAIKRLLESGKNESKDVLYSNIAIQAYDLYKQNKDAQQAEMIIDKFFLKELLRIGKEIDASLGSESKNFFTEYAKLFIDTSNIQMVIRAKDHGRQWINIKDFLSESGNIDIRHLGKSYLETPKVVIERLVSSDMHKGLLEAISRDEKNGNLLEFERVLEDYLMKKTKEAKMISAGPEVMFAYVHAKDIELLNMRLIYISKMNGKSPDSIKERLRETYA